ncbi:hypothetical protein CQ12_40355 [Bradyrhizobium jicamae]|uniref:Uncharacterized protein n=1 Tax=Bradyrhizobium jicamae TaxID=280332 RepID=A0A0R3M4U4_9BRAD|nr:hypothetical protein CQ12_40355 [Bradyrhizobium jicamae]
MPLMLRLNDTYYFTGASVAVQVHSIAIPMIVEMASLGRTSCEIRIEQADAFTARIANAWIDNTLGSRATHAGGQGLAFAIAMCVERRGMGRITAAQIVQRCLHRHDDLAKLRCPSWGLVGPGHKAGVMVGRFQQCDLKPVSDIKNAVAAVAKSAGPIRADMCERCHQITRTRPANPSFRRHEIDVADRIHQPRVCFLLRGNEKRPISRVRDIFE